MKPIERQPTDEERLLGDLVRSHFPGGVIPEFRPFALYYEGMDQIVVQVRDCSTTHKGSDNVLFLFEENYPADGERPQIVGFSIEPIHLLCVLSTDRVNLNHILDVVLGMLPDRAAEIEIARGLIARLPSQEVDVF
jgi:hypothetical protein